MNRRKAPRSRFHFSLVAAPPSLKGNTSRGRRREEGPALSGDLFLLSRDLPIVSGESASVDKEGCGDSALLGPLITAISFQGDRRRSVGT